jgi:predicted esterase
VVETLDIDPSHVALGGISDGAGYALSMGLAYGDSFNHVMVFSGGLMIPFRRQGSPHIFIAHGLNDVQMPIDRTGRRFASELKIDGYDVTYREYEGGHAVPRDIVREAFEWFLADTKRP